MSSQIQNGCYQNMIYWTKVISSSGILFYKELSHIKQTLINNTFSNPVIDEIIKLTSTKFRKKNNTTPLSGAGKINIEITFCRN